MISTSFNALKREVVFQNFSFQLWLLKGIYSLYGKHVHDVHQLVREKITVLKIHQKRLTYLLF